MNEILQFFDNLIDPNWIMDNGGLYLVLLIVFIETGIFFGFFLPGDPLLFIAGIVLANVQPSTVDPLLYFLYWAILICIAGISGNFLGYWIGQKSGKRLSRREDGRFFKKKYLIQARAFFVKHGGSAVIIARFVPVIRSFAPLTAGIVNMDIKKFAYFNIIGCLLWVGIIVTAGYLLGENVWVKNNLEWIVILIVLVATMPVLIKYLSSLGRDKTRARRKVR
ncbi:DedA family protein [Olivibacter sitiensis]|uniref:DedA family protein n=1 Tax=Olivibacter sitiensis TaxID=376470 RepID=UPI000401A159|nr:VTT domain-containing protein [Olivibacter sitiensis]